MKNAELLKKYY